MNYVIVMTTWFPSGRPGADRLEAANRAVFSWLQHLAPAPKAVIVALALLRDYPDIVMVRRRYAQ